VTAFIKYITVASDASRIAKCHQ